MERRLEREMGKMISGIREDDKSFQVRRFTLLNHVIVLASLYFIRLFCFQLVLDVGDFQPNEVTVKTTDKNIIVHGTFSLPFDGYFVY